MFSSATLYQITYNHCIKNNGAVIKLKAMVCIKMTKRQRPHIQLLPLFRRKRYKRKCLESNLGNGQGCCG